MNGTAANIYGTAPTFIGTVPADTALTATDAAKTGWRAINLNNPMVWLVGIVAITIGAAGFAGGVRLGPSKVTANIGKV